MQDPVMPSKLPPRIARLKMSERGFPVPFFVAWVDGVADFRIVDPAKMKRCVVEHLCWICGERMGANVAYMIGPMCTITRTSSEPPMHVECAEFSAKVCQFLTRPKQKRNVHNMPEDSVEPAGLMIERNPGVSCMWVTREKLRMIPDQNRNVLFNVGTSPERVQWFAEGRPATRAEVVASIESGYPILAEQAEDPEALRELEALRREALQFLPTS